MFHWQLSFLKVSTRFILFAMANINKKEETTYKRPMILRIFANMKAYINTIILLLLLFASATSLIGQEKVTPEKGEGISAFLRRHGLTGADAKKQFEEINRGKFSKDGGLLMGQTYILPTPSDAANATTLRQSSSPSKARTIKEPLFGKQLKNVTIKDHTLEGASFYLVSGHGGPDPGAVSKVGGVELHEDEYAYDIILRLARNLMEHGAKVHIIIQDKKDGIRDDKYLKNSKRETCMGRKIPRNHTKRLQQRCEVINQLARKDTEKYKRAIFIHVDSRRVKEQIDVFLYHAPNSTLGRRLANNIRNTIEDKYGQHQPGRGFKGTVSDRRLYVLRETTPVAAFLELGNIQNEKDRKRLVIPNNRQALANWICQGIIKDYKK